MDVGVQLFVSWAHHDEKLKSSLLDLLKPRLGIVRNLDITWWEDSDLDIGTAWDDGIKARLDACDYALQLLSPDFFASRYIREYEIPPFDRGMKRTLPVGLVFVPLDGTADLLGIEDLQVFRHHGRSFSELTRRHDREMFADGLCRKILDRIKADRGSGG